MFLQRAKDAINPKEDIITAIFDSTYSGGDVFALVIRVVNRRLEVRQLIPGLQILTKHHVGVDLIRMIMEVTLEV